MNVSSSNDASLDKVVLENNPTVIPALSLCWAVKAEMGLGHTCLVNLQGKALRKQHPCPSHCSTGVLLKELRTHTGTHAHTHRHTLQETMLSTVIQHSTLFRAFVPVEFQVFHLKNGGSNAFLLGEFHRIHRGVCMTSQIHPLHLSSSLFLRCNWEEKLKES